MSQSGTPHVNSQVRNKDVANIMTWCLIFNSLTLLSLYDRSWGEKPGSSWWIEGALEQTQGHYNREIIYEANWHLAIKSSIIYHPNRRKEEWFKSSEANPKRFDDCTIKSITAAHILIYVHHFNIQNTNMATLSWKYSPVTKIK